MSIPYLVFSGSKIVKITPQHKRVANVSRLKTAQPSVVLPKVVVQSKAVAQPNIVRPNVSNIVPQPKTVVQVSVPSVVQQKAAVTPAPESIVKVQIAQEQTPTPQPSTIERKPKRKKIENVV